ncbi:MAG: segregation/condensation protein A [bacterium]|nr:segregation/condensation protein A [bacterium]
MTDTKFEIKIDVCEGPLSLLLYLIEKEHINIKDVRISQITEQFIEYVNFIKELDLSEVGDFLLMATRLMKIKSNVLFPEELEKEEEKIIHELIEAKKYKEIAKELAIMNAYAIQSYFRKPYEIKEEEKYIEVSMYALIDALRKLLNKLPDAQEIKISKDKYKIEYMMDVILTKAKEGTFGFIDFFSGKEKSYIISGFLALLELLKTAKVKAYQKEAFGEIYIYV